MSATSRPFVFKLLSHCHFSWLHHSSLHSFAITEQYTSGLATLMSLKSMSLRAHQSFTNLCSPICASTSPLQLSAVLPFQNMQTKINQLKIIKCLLRDTYILVTQMSLQKPASYRCFNAFMHYTVFLSSHLRLNSTRHPLRFETRPSLTCDALMPRRERYCNSKLVLVGTIMW